MRKLLTGVLAAVAMLYASGAQAQSRPFNCGELPTPKPSLPQIAPIFRSTADLADSDFDCLAWQDFIYLNWPVTAGRRGVPNKGARFNAPGPTVWESYKSVDDIFLPNGANPGPWDQPRLFSAQQRLASAINAGTVRRLKATSKVSRAVFANVALHGSAIPPDVLKEITQAGGGTLYDLTGTPVYYEVAMNRLAYDYVVKNALYDAARQIAFAEHNVISLPMAAASGDESGLEVKAAWKVLSPTEVNNRRFHTVQALLPGLTNPVPVGLVGFHMFIANGLQGAWATFAQVDNAPGAGPTTNRPFSFFNPNCRTPGTGSPCPVNVKDANPGQVTQVFPNDPTAERLNDLMHKMLVANDPRTPWQFYNLVNVQWALNPIALSRLPAPASAPLPDGKPNTPTLVNAVLETFLQRPKVSCLACHEFATVAASGGISPPFASSYSFAFGHAATPR